MTESTGLQLLRKEVIFDMAKQKKLTKAERSEVAKATWRRRKRAGGSKKTAAASKKSATKRSATKRSAA